MNIPKKWIEDLKEWNIELSERQAGQFMDFYDLLIEWNRVMNLTAITEFEEVCKKHFSDSLSLVNVIPYEELKSGDHYLIDVGTGAGFPGIPLAITFPNLKITLLDSLQKRVNFLNTVIEALGLKNCEALQGRAEDFAKPLRLREKYDFCVSRAVANLSTLSEYCLPFVRENGCFISYKAEKTAEEIRQAEYAISVLGGHIEEQKEFVLPKTDISRSLIVIRKVSPTPEKYPRKAGTPSKKPISKP